MIFYYNHPRDIRELPVMQVEPASVDYIYAQLESNAKLNNMSVEEFAYQVKLGDPNLLLKYPTEVPLDSRPR